MSTVLFYALLFSVSNICFSDPATLPVLHAQAWTDVQIRSGIAKRQDIACAARQYSEK